MGSCFRLLSTTDPRTVQREVLGLRVFIGFKVQESKAEGSAFADTGSKAPGVWTDLEFRSVLNTDFCCTSAAEIHVKRALLFQVFGLQGCEASEVVLSPQRWFEVHVQEPCSIRRKYYYVVRDVILYTLHAS